MWNTLSYVVLINRHSSHSDTHRSQHSMKQDIRCTTIILIMILSILSKSVIHGYKNRFTGSIRTIRSVKSKYMTWYSSWLSESVIFVYLGNQLGYFHNKLKENFELFMGKGFGNKEVKNFMYIHIKTITMIPYVVQRWVGRWRNYIRRKYEI